MALTFVLITGCTPDEPAPTVPTPSLSAPASEPPEAEEPAGALSGLGADADWDNFILDCANTEQEPVIQTVATGDVTGDHVADAVVARTCAAATPYVPSTIEVFDGKSPAARPWRIGTALLGDVATTDRPWVIALAVQSGVIMIQAHGGETACPKLRLTYRYQLDGTAFRRLDRVAGTSTTCLPIQE
ncbi:hypothetical protein [Actinoplanes utahensis]|uniref:hypothetical protein n=1 Tax=Actinoplanes utahensis TaxID=1869 RepID=UPI00126A468D|nr:hypothetical protein [Actinoplanes utahensis]